MRASPPPEYPSYASSVPSTLILSEEPVSNIVVVLRQYTSDVGFIYVFFILMYYQGYFTITLTPFTMFTPLLKVFSSRPLRS